jgi:hypothetical protein
MTKSLFFRALKGRHFRKPLHNSRQVSPLQGSIRLCTSPQGLRRWAALLPALRACICSPTPLQIGEDQEPNESLLRVVNNRGEVHPHAEGIMFPRTQNISLRFDRNMAHAPNDHLGRIVSFEGQNAHGM